MGDVFKAVSDPTRRAVLQLLRDGPLTAGEIAERFTISKPAMSAHFNVLREADLVRSDKVGKSVIYHLKLSVLEEAMVVFAEAMRLGQGDGEPSRRQEAKA